MNYPKQVKQVLMKTIRDMASEVEPFVRNPGKDFTRNRKLGFETTVHCLLSMEGGSLNKELLELFRFSTDTATASAFVQQRRKILPKALEFLFKKFCRAFPQGQTYRGYQLLAFDGTALNIAHNPDDKDTYFQTKTDVKGFNQLHLNALYDLCSRRYVDAIIQPGRLNNEYRAMADMIDRCKAGKMAICIADRGLESYNLFAHAEQKGMYYLIRARQSDCGSMSYKFGLPGTESFDAQVQLTLTRKRTAAAKEIPNYKFIQPNGTFDYLVENDYYPITLRVVRFPITADTFECVITNLPENDFPPDELKKLYGMRWGIETSFRELKYSIGLSSFHAKRVDFIKQEIFARLVLYNFCELITTHVAIHQKNKKHVYQANYTLAIHICRHFLRFHTGISSSNIEALIRKNLLPVRPGRSGPRKLRCKSVVSFLYRIA